VDAGRPDICIGALPERLERGRAIVLRAPTNELIRYRLKEVVETGR